MVDVSYPDQPGHRGVDTSMDAAGMIAPMSSQLRALVYRTLHAHPAGLTCDEVCRIAGLPRYSLQPRLTELKHADSIHDTGRRRLNVSGARAIVWAVSVAREKAA